MKTARRILSLTTALLLTSSTYSAAGAGGKEYDIKFRDSPRDSSELMGDCLIKNGVMGIIYGKIENYQKEVNEEKIKEIEKEFGEILKKFGNGNGNDLAAYLVSLPEDNLEIEICTPCKKLEFYLKEADGDSVIVAYLPEKKVIKEVGKELDKIIPGSKKLLEMLQKKK